MPVITILFFYFLSKIGDLGRVYYKKACVIFASSYIVFPHFWRPREKCWFRKLENKGEI